MRTYLLGAAFIVSLITFATPSIAMTCTARHKECIEFCQKGRPGSCTNYCATALPTCMQTGCWKTPQSNKCGYSKG